MGCCCSCFPSAPSPEDPRGSTRGCESDRAGLPRHVHVDCVYNARIAGCFRSSTRTPECPTPSFTCRNRTASARVRRSLTPPGSRSSTSTRESWSEAWESCPPVANHSPNRPLFEGQLPVPPNTPFRRPWVVPLGHRRPKAIQQRMRRDGRPHARVGQGTAVHGLPPHSFTFGRSDKTGALRCGKTADGAKRHPRRRRSRCVAPHLREVRARPRGRRANGPPQPPLRRQHGRVRRLDIVFMR